MPRSLFLLLGLLAACGGGTAYPPPTPIALTQKALLEGAAFAVGGEPVALVLEEQRLRALSTSGAELLSVPIAAHVDVVRCYDSPCDRFDCTWLDASTRPWTERVFAVFDPAIATLTRDGQPLAPAVVSACYPPR